MDARYLAQRMGESSLEQELAWQIAARKLPTPMRQFRYAPPRRFKADFYWPSQRLIVECQGAIWTGGRHVRGKGYESNCEGMAEAMLRGYRVLWVTAKAINSGRALKYLEVLLA